MFSARYYNGTVQKYYRSEKRLGIGKVAYVGKYLLVKASFRSFLYLLLYRYMEKFY
jgi:hypothetical protein